MEHLKSNRPKVMGILNVTPDSFSDGGRFATIDQAVAHGIKLYLDGADIIDVGGESTKPGAEPVSEEEELSRVLPVIRRLSKAVPIPLSIDTMKPQVAKEAFNEGATIINYVGGEHYEEMISFAVQAKAPLCVMHMRGTPQTMQKRPVYEEGVVNHLLQWFEAKTSDLIKRGVAAKNIMIDPGIGFGKTIEDNFAILENLQKFKALGFLLLVGLSRKSFMSKTIGKPADRTLASTIAMNTVALLGKADIIRVHDVAEHRDVVDVLYLNILK